MKSAMMTRKIASKLTVLLAMLALSASAFSGLRLRQSVDEGYATKTEETFDYINAFLAGFKSQETLPSATNCTLFLEQSILVYNDTRNEWTNQTEELEWRKANPEKVPLDAEPVYNTTSQDKIFNTTEWISDSLAPSSRYCVFTGLEGWNWATIKQSQFDGFSDVFQAWLQSLLGNVITFNSIYKKIEEATEAENKKEIFFWYGRFTTLFINFEPIPDDHLDFDDSELLMATGATPSL